MEVLFSIIHLLLWAIFKRERQEKLYQDERLANFPIMLKPNMLKIVSPNKMLHTLQLDLNQLPVNELK